MGEEQVKISEDKLNEEVTIPFHDVIMAWNVLAGFLRAGLVTPDQAKIVGDYADRLKTTIERVAGVDVTGKAADNNSSEEK